MGKISIFRVIFEARFQTLWTDIVKFQNYVNSAYVCVIIIILARTPEIGQGLGRILSCGARKPEQTDYDYCGLRTTTLFHDILILP